MTRAHQATGETRAYTIVPGRDCVELVAFDPELASNYLECELQTKRWLVENVEPDWIIFDVGANIGYFSILFAKLSPRGTVYAFEPTETIELLKRNVAHHGCTNIHPFQRALGNKSGAHEDEIFRIWGAERKAYDFTTTDGMADELNLDRLDLIKIDVDSFDFEVLRGSRAVLEKFNPWVLVELSHALEKRQQTVTQALEWLSAQGYKDALVLDDYNFLLKRRPREVSRRGMRTSLTITMEQRPILLRPAFEKAYELPEFFASAPVAVNAAAASPCASASDAVRIFGPGPRWTYAATIGAVGVNIKDLIGPVIVEASVTSFGGHAGIGCVGADGETYLGQELIVAVAGVRQHVSLLIEQASLIDKLIIRNADPDGSAIDIIVSDVRAYATKPADASFTAPVLRPDRTTISAAELLDAYKRNFCVSGQPVSGSSAVDIIPVEVLGEAFDFARPYLPPTKIIRKRLADFKMETDDAPILSYIYRQHQPKRHLEFGTWEGFGATLCAQSCAAEIWTINLPSGESAEDGETVYTISDPQLAELPNSLKVRAGAAGERVRTDAGDFIGWRYRAAGFSNRVHQILCNSLAFDEATFEPGFFDSILIDGAHTAEIVASDTIKSLTLLRSGGLLLWHDFCPDAETLQDMESPRGVVQAVATHLEAWRPHFKSLFWIRPSWILAGIKA